MVKYNLVQLGYKCGFCVYAHGLTHKVDEINEQIKMIGDFGEHKFRNKEWLYDVHWYKDIQNTHYMPETLSLAVECEFSYKREGDGSGQNYSAVKFDFQKLLVTNASFRLLVFIVASKEDFDKLISKYFTLAIKYYKNLTTGSEFLIAAYCKKTEELLTKKLLKN